MMYVGGVFVDIAEISKFSSVNCGLFPLRNIIFRNYNLSPKLNFALV